MNLVCTSTELLIFLLSLVVTICMPNTNHTDYQLSVIQEYEQKICSGANTCNLVNQVPSIHRTLKVRSCMCDEQCSMYGDCCEDANVTNSYQYVPNEFTCVASAFDGGVYMKTSCPITWDQSEEIKENCQAPNETFLQIDTLLRVPVTNIKHGITYRNLFCALCHGEYDFEFWSVGFTYELIANSELKDDRESSTQQTASTTDLTDVAIVSTNPSVNFFNNESTMSVSSMPTVEELLANLKLNETLLFWMVSVHKSVYKCLFDAVVPDSLTDYVRFCQLDVIDTCGVDSPPDPHCAGFTKYIYFNESAVYKNPACLACNANLSSEQINYTASCPQIQQNHSTQLTKLHINHEYVPKLNRCSQILKGSSAYTLLCKDSTSAPDLCLLSRRADTQKVCQFSRFFPNDEIEFRNNGMIYLKLYNTIYPHEEWISDSSRPNETFICGTYITGWYHTQIMLTLEDWLTAVLIKISMVCLVLQLAVFLLLPEMQNLSGKCLAAFCATLLVSYMGFDIGPRLSSCVITAVIVHFSLLSCFTWMLLMSYDCWLGLYRATSQLRSTTGKRTKKFVVYGIFCLMVPLVIVGISIYIELMPGRTTDICKYKPRYGASDDCFIFSKTALFILFVLPATIMFVGNIAFFAHTAIMIHRSQRQTVNPNTRHDFLLYTRLALLMGLTWTLGSLTHATNNPIVAFLFAAMNTSQGIFIFFGFTFKKKVRDSLLKRYKDNRFISHLVTTYANDDNTVVTELKPRTAD